MRPQNISIVLLPIFWPNIPPINLALLKAYLAVHNISIDAIDFNNYFFSKASSELKKEWLISCNRSLEKNILNILRSDFRSQFDSMLEQLLSYDLIGFSCYKSNFITTIEIARILKEKNPSLKIIFGGPEIARQFFKLGDTFSKQLDAFCDFFVIGEGELPFFKFIIDDIGTNKVAKFWELDSLTNLPAPDYSNFDFKLYPKSRHISLMYSRGCIRSCAFCSERLLYKKFRLFSPYYIIEQIGELKKKDIEYFVFHDSLINGDLYALELLCDKIIEQFGSIKWEAQIAIRSDMSDRLFHKIKQSGCYHLFVGLESGCDITLDRMNKGYTPKEAIDFFLQLNLAKLSFGVSIIVGFPGETDDDYAESLNFLIKNKALIPKIEQINPFVYYAGTKIPREHDYKNPPGSIKNCQIFIDRITDAGFKCTNAFMLNLVEH